MKTRHRRGVAGAAIVAALMLGRAGQATQAAAPVQTPAAAPAGNAEHGKQIYTKYGCYECHGREGQGSPASGPRLGPNPLPLAGFVRYVRAPKGEMPPYTAKVVSDQELADIRAFLQARPRPADPTVLPPD